MKILRANPELKNTFEKLIVTMKVPVKWNGMFAVIDNCIILQGEVRSLFFHFDSRKAVTNLIDLPVREDETVDTAENIWVRNVINMILYAFGKWGTIRGLRVDKSFSQLNDLFGSVMKDLDVEPDYTPEFFRFYKDGIRITYEEVIQYALLAKEKETEEKTEETQGLWHNVLWQTAEASFEKVPTTLKERQKERLGNNFYMVGYLCPSCKEKLHMVVYPEGKDFKIETQEGAVLLARAYTCSRCNCFYTPRPGRMLSEGQVYLMPFEDDRKAYEDYQELLGKDGARISNYNCNRYADGRSADDGAAGKENLEELCQDLEGCSESELNRLSDRMEEGYYPDESILAYEETVREDLKRKVREKKSRRSFGADGMDCADIGSPQDEGTAGDKEDTQEYRPSEIHTNRKNERDNDAESTKEGHRRSPKNRVQTSYEPDRKLSPGKDTSIGCRENRQAEQGRNSEPNQKEVQNRNQAVGVKEFTNDRTVPSNAQNRKHSRDTEIEINQRNKEQEASLQDQERENGAKEAARKKYDARMQVLNRLSGRQLSELKVQLGHETKLSENEKQDYLRQVEQAEYREQAQKLSEKADRCEGKTYAVLKRMQEEVESSGLPAEMKSPLMAKLKNWLNLQAGNEVRQLMERMPPRMGRSRYKSFMEKLKSFEGADLTPYEQTLKNAREQAERQELANLVKSARKNTRADLAELMEKLQTGEFLPELAQPYLEKLEDKIRRLDEKAIAEICGDPVHMSFEEGMEALEKIGREEFLPDLKTNAVEMLKKRLARIKTDESELLVRKLKDELEEAGIGENERHHFYPARRILQKQATPEETQVIEYAMASYAAGCGMFEYPVLIVDTARNESGKEGLILTPDHLYLSTFLTAYRIPVSSIEKVTAQNGLLGRSLSVQQKNGTKTKIPYAVEGKELPAFAEVMNNFVHYLQEKPDSRNVTYLAEEKHEQICCFRCGYVYKEGTVCPKCGYKKNG